MAPAVAQMGRRLAAAGILALAGPSMLEGQVDLASALSTVALIAHVPPRATIGRPAPARGTARPGEETVRVRLSTNTGYRLMVVGIGAGSQADPAARLWVQAETGRFVEVTSGAAVTVIRGRHGVAEWEPQVTFRREHSESVSGPHPIPVRYEVRIDPAI